ncbi:MAG: NUDIX domain-containing protein [Candidatus Hodarchaeota archaeon]
MPVCYDILWKGRLDLKRLTWKFDPSWTYDLPPELEKARTTIWRQATKDFPHIYDGELLCLTSYHLEANESKLSVGTIRFSQMMVHERLNIPIHDGYGSLGVQVAIFTDDRRHLLVGERSQKSDYRPGWWTLPGGIFEVADVNGSINKAINREMKEEVALKLHQSFILRAMLKMHPHTSTALLVEAQIAQGEAIDVSRPVRGNEEWEEKTLRWLPCLELPHLDHERIFDGLDFIAGEWRAFLKKERSLFFD